MNRSASRRAEPRRNRIAFAIDLAGRCAALFLAATPWLLWRRASGDPVTEESWSAWWHGWTWFILAASSVVMVWFSIGGIRDYVRLRRDLRSYRADESDDGRVG